MVHRMSHLQSVMVVLSSGSEQVNRDSDGKAKLQGRAWEMERGQDCAVQQRKYELERLRKRNCGEQRKGERGSVVIEGMFGYLVMNEM